MKNIKLSILAGAVFTTLMLPSCKKYLEVISPSTLAPEAVFTSVSYTNTTLIGVYNQLIGDNGYGSRISTLFPQSADDFRTSGSYSAPGTDRRGISVYHTDPYNTDIINPYYQLYSGIDRANICIKYIPLSSLYTSGGADAASMKKLYGEALALRSVFFFELVRNWGDIVAPFVPSSDASADLNPVATDKKVVLDHLIDDLKIAEDLVPWRTESGYTDTRFTKGAVKALRARIALFRGGYLLNATTHAKERDPNYKKYYQIAMTECSDVMARRDQHDLNPSFENVFKTLHTGTRLDDKYEMMFRVGAYGGNATTDSKLGYYNGMKFNAASIYGAAGAGITPAPTYFYEFDQLGDCRRDVTIASFEIDANSQKVLSQVNTMCDGKFRRSWSGIIGGTAQNYGIDWPVMRFADVLLMFAEADNEVNGAPSAAAQSALLEIRKRAYVGFESRIPATPTDHDGFFTAIVKERLLEFGGEGIRKYDLIRWNLLGSKIQELRDKINAFAAGTGAYANMPLYVYNKAANYSPTNTAVQEENTLDTYGGAPSATLFQPGLGSTTAPTGYNVIKWRAAISTNATTGDAALWAQYYVPEREVFPYPAASLLYNTKITQNYGY